MADVPTLPPELCRSVVSVARTLVAAARSWTLYPSEHPAVRGSLDRLASAIAGAAAGGVFSFGVTPDDLLVEGIPVKRERVTAEAAAWLHARDILQITVAGDVAPRALQPFLALLAEDPASVRRRGGPAAVWAEQRDRSILIEQIDFSRVLEERDVEHPARRKDDLWRAIVRAVLEKRRALDETAHARLLDIAGDVVAIAQLAGDVMAPHYAADGSPMLTSQAAAVVAAYRHLTGIIEVLAPDRRQEVMQNLAAATASLDPHVVMQILHTAEDPRRETASVGGAAPMLGGLVAAFDDLKVAQLLATTLAIDGQASERLASVFDTIAPDAQRKHRVLTLTKSLLGEMDFGRRDHFQTLWSSMEELLLTYNERPFVSASYRTGLDGVAARAEAMAGGDLPEDLVALIDTLGQENVRRLSVTLLIDLLRMEQDATLAGGVARDLAAFAEDLLMAGDYDAALTVVTALGGHAGDPASIAGEACRVALDGIVATAAFHDAAELLGEMSDAEAERFSRVCERIGPAAADALRDLLEAEELTPGRGRASAIIARYKERAVSRLAPLTSSPRWAAQRNAADLLGEIGAPDAVPLLHPLLRGSDARVIRAAVRALATIKSPVAARAIHTALRAATGEQRRAVVEALVAERDARVVPVLVRIVEESNPFGADHAIVLDALAALATVGDDQAIPVLTATMRRKKLWGGRKLKTVKQAAVKALHAIGSPAAADALQDAAQNGDRLLRRLVQ